MFELFLFLAVLLLLLLIGYLMMHYVTHPQRTSFEQSRRQETANNYWLGYDDYDSEEMDITTPDGYLIHGTYLPGKDPSSDRYVILTHGYTYNRHGSIKYAHVFYELGFHIYLYDLRYHGANEYQNCFCSMGEKECRDLTAVIDEMYRRFGSQIRLGLHGESLGAATSLLALSQRQSLAFCVADCPFGNLKHLLYHQAKQMFHMPKFMVHVANFVYGIRYHNNFFNIAPQDAIRTNQVPLLLIHGDADDFIPPIHSEYIFANCPSTCKKTLHMTPGAAHAGSYGMDPDRYNNWIRTFLDEISMTH